MGKLIGPIFDHSRIETVLVSVKGGLWQDKVIQIILPCVKLGSLIM